MKKEISIWLVFCFLSTQVADSQLNTKKNEMMNRISLKLNYSNNTSKNIIPSYGANHFVLVESFYNKNRQYSFEGLFNFNKLLTAGLYLAYSKGTFISNEILSTDLNSVSYEKDRFGNSFFYGIKTELQLLPLLNKHTKIRFNVYCPMQFGLVSQQISSFTTDIKTWDKPAFEIGAGLGISYIFTKNIGLFGEYQMGKFYNDRKSQWKAGVLVTF